MRSTAHEASSTFRKMSEMRSQGHFQILKSPATAVQLLSRTSCSSRTRAPWIWRCNAWLPCTTKADLACSWKKTWCRRRDRWSASFWSAQKPQGTSLAGLLHGTTTCIPCLLHLNTFPVKLHACKPMRITYFARLWLEAQRELRERSMHAEGAASLSFPLHRRQAFLCSHAYVMP
jgi:hypothetical protein